MLGARTFVVSFPAPGITLAMPLSLAGAGGQIDGVTDELLTSGTATTACGGGAKSSLAFRSMNGDLKGVFHPAGEWAYRRENWKESYNNKKE
ncbi:hypothetical protein BV898_17504 [Hypsibius exemplaris]|uniref:Uncharacterized protein n=1 Tax=Hypsibius exemplaris TaxID=2072580 RepID=A0A9X6NGZ5_HYPEX|nr:hypothetical protein BV898_17504 [Hypsibius exemplaris]